MTATLNTHCEVFLSWEMATSSYHFTSWHPAHLDTVSNLAGLGHWGEVGYGHGMKKVTGPHKDQGL